MAFYHHPCLPSLGLGIQPDFQAVIGNSKVSNTLEFQGNQIPDRTLYQ